MVILRLKRLFCIAALLPLAAGCSYLKSDYVPTLVKPYRIDVQQGNFVTQAEVDRLQIGMSKEQVKFIMGTPLLNSPFHADRWDYTYRLTKGNGSVVQYRYTVTFEQDKLVKHGGESLPENQAEFLTGPGGDRRAIAPATNTAPAKKAATPAKTGQETPAGTERAPVLN